MTSTREYPAKKARASATAKLFRGLANWFRGPPILVAGEAAQTEHRHWLWRFLWGRKQARVLVPEELILRETVLVPREAGSDIGSAATLSILPRLPFDPSEVVFRTDQESLSSKDSVVRVETCIVPRASLKREYENLQSHGIEASSFIISSNFIKNNSEHKILPHEIGISLFKQQRYIPFLAMLSLSASIAFSFWIAANAIMTEKTNIDYYNILQLTLTKKLHEGNALRNERLEKSRVINERIFSTELLFGKLRQLSQTIDGGANIERLSFRDSTFLLTGTSKDPTALLERAEREFTSSEAEFVGPITVERGSALERFTLRVNWQVRSELE